MVYLAALRRTALAFFLSAGRISFVSSFKLTAARCAMLVWQSCLGSAFLFSLHGFCSSNLNLMAYVNSAPSGFVNISPAPEPSIQDDPSVKRVQGSAISSGSVMGTSGDSSSGRSIIKSASICPLIDAIGLY
ncbi:hypothetical protein Tco_1285879 [Tanacetum coccineum]